MKASPQTIYIRSDGSIDPPTAPISSVDNIIYNFTDNISDSIVVERSNIIIDGKGYILQGSGWWSGFYLSGINNVTIQNTNIKDFLYGVLLDEASFNTVSGNNITDNSDLGVWLNSSSFNTVSGNNITYNNKDGVLLFEQSYNNTISGNTIANNTLRGIVLFSSSNNTFYGNNVENNTDGFELYTSSINTITGNRVENNTDCGIALHSLSNNNSIFRNGITNNELYGIYLSASYNNSISENEVKNNGRIGIFLETKNNNNSLTGNNIVKNGEGVNLKGSSNNTVSGNSIVRNHWGIGLSWSSNNNITGNDITANNFAWWSSGIGLTESYNNTISKNSIAKNSIGIKLTTRQNRPYTSSNNTIYHNDFVDNTQQVVIDGDSYTNYWDNGREGNYWSDYRDRYPDAKEIDGSGIWDTPYVIDENNQDNYPLMNPIPISEEGLIIISEIKAKPWTSMNVPFANISEARDYIEHFEENGKPEANFGTIPLNITLTNAGAVPAENIEINTMITGTAALVALDENNMTNDYVYLHPFQYPYSIAVGTIDSISTQKVTLEIPVKYMSIFCGLFKYNEEDEADVLFTIVELNVDLEINGTNFEAVTTSTKLLGIGDPYNLGVAILHGIINRLAEKAEEDLKELIREYVLSITVGSVTETYPVIAGQKVVYPTTIDPGTTSITISALLPQGISLAQLAITIGTLTIGIASTAVYGFATLIVKPPDLQPGEAEITIETYSPDVTFTLTVVKIIGIDVTKPVANAGEDQKVDEDTEVTFDASASYDDIGIMGYEWTFTDLEPETLTGEKPTYVFERPGTYVVTLKVTDVAGKYDTDSVTITVLDVTKPIANFDYEKSDLTVSFNASESSDNVGIDEYTWDFGDGNSGTGITTTHTYAEPGSYNVTLIVKDAAGNSDTKLVTIEMDLPSTETLPWYLVVVVGAAIALGLGIAIRRKKRQHQTYS